MTLINGFTDQRDREQTPKHRDCAAEPKRGVPLYNCRSSKYVPYQSLRMTGHVDGSGEADESHGWYCPDCGSPVVFADDDNIPSCCSHCGSTLPAEYR